MHNMCPVLFYNTTPSLTVIPSTSKPRLTRIFKMTSKDLVTSELNGPFFQILVYFYSKYRATNAKIGAGALAALTRVEGMIR